MRVFFIPLEKFIGFLIPIEKSCGFLIPIEKSCGFLIPFEKSSTYILYILWKIDWFLGTTWTSINEATEFKYSSVKAFQLIKLVTAYFENG